MKKKLIILINSLIFYFLSSNYTFAYLDPGSGSIILQAILAALATAGATITFYWRKIKIYFKNIFSKKKNEENKDSIDK